MTVNEYIESNIPALLKLYGRSESMIVLETLLSDMLGLHFRISDNEKRKAISPGNMNKLNESLGRLIQGVPVQYVTGVAYFMDLKLNVTEEVLIPRPETEELVELVLQYHASRNNLSILDLGCGSGCIAIKLAGSIPGAKVTGVDISNEALMLTARNAQLNGVVVDTFRFDILKDKLSGTTKFDLIVSNPPYIHPSESAEVDAQVLNFEPHLALFTPQEDVHIFYRKIMSMAEERLNPDGRIYFEVNPSHSEELGLMVRSMGWVLHKHVDISGKTRIFEIGKIS